MTNRCGENNTAYKHGHLANGKMSPTYSSWTAMFSRTRPKNTVGTRYVGIDICPEWKDFRVFLSEMGERPKNTTLDRIDSGKGYYKENCRWATYSHQAYNKRKRLGCEVPYRGVCRQHKRWCAYIKVEKKRIHLGYFDTPEEAALAYNDAIVKFKLSEFIIPNSLASRLKPEPKKVTVKRWMNVYANDLYGLTFSAMYDSEDVASNRNKQAENYTYLDTVEVEITFTDSRGVV